MVSGILERFLFVALIGLIIWLPLPWGSNRSWAVHLFCAVTFSISAVWLLLYAHGRVAFTDSFRKSRAVWLLIGGAALWGAVQSIEVPLQWVQVLSPTAALIHEGVAHLNAKTTAALSVDPYRTEIAALKGCAYFLLFALILLLVRSRARVRVLAYAIVICGVFEAVYGSAKSLSGLEFGVFGRELQKGVATGTFVNRNHLAGFLEMCLAMGVGLLITGNFASPGRNWRDWLRGAANFLLSDKAFVRIGVVIMAIALVLTRSRMGNTGFAVSLTISTFLYLAVVGSSGFSKGIIAVILGSILVVDLLIVGSYFGIEELAERLEQTTVTEASNRVDLFDYALRYVHAYLPLGSGAGSFYAAFLPYSGPEVISAYDHAHNDYIESLGEWGIIGFVFIAVAVMLSLGTALIAVRRRHDPLLRAVGFASLMGIVAILIHSFVDFNLQIPANAGYFIVLMAMAGISAGLSHHRRSV